MYMCIFMSGLFTLGEKGLQIRIGVYLGLRIIVLRIIYLQLSSEFQMLPSILLPLTGSCFAT